MSYYITSAGFEIDYTDLKDASLYFYLKKFGLDHYFILFLHEQIDFDCISIIEDEDMNDLDIIQEDKMYLYELKEFLIDFF